jgi:hypothetical protein
MILNDRLDSGAEEWLCPECGRRMLMRWPPHYERLVIVHGDDSAVHVGGKGGVRVSGISVTPVPATEEVGEVARNDIDWLRDNGIDWDGTPA